MTNRTVWHPQKSLANDGSEEGGRGSFVSTDQDHEPQTHVEKAKIKKSVIMRRRTPTVDVSVLVSYAAADKKSSQSKEKQKPRDTYNTIECREGESEGILACSSVVYRRKPQVSSSSDSELCGWRDKELESYRELSDKSMTFSSLDRSKLQQQADGLRSSLQSRAKRRSAAPSSRGKRRGEYVFQHFTDVHGYIEHYRQHHSFTSLTVPDMRKHVLSNNEAVKDPECLCGGSCTQEARGNKQDSRPEQQNLRQQEKEDPYLYLRELVSRLGVKALVQNGQKRTPPSINKKTKTDEDLVIYSNGGNTIKEEENGPDEQISLPIGNNSHQNSPRTTNPVEVCEGQSTLLELPQIPQTPHIPLPKQRKVQSTNSVISVSKYLQVTSSQQQQQRELEGCENRRKDEEEKPSSQDCLPHLPSSGSSSLISATAENITQEDDLNGYRNAVEFSTPNSATMKLAAQEQLVMLDRSQKERLLTNKAHSLGLTSRDWGKTSQGKRMLGNRFLEAKKEEESKREQMSSRNERGTKGRQSVMSRPQTRMSRPQTRMSRPHTRLSVAAVDESNASSGTSREGSRMDRSRMEESRMERSRTEPKRTESRMEGVRTERSRMERLRREESRRDGSRTNHRQRNDYTAHVDDREWEERWREARKSSRDHQPHHTRQRQEDSKKWEQLKDIYDSSRNSTRVVANRCPMRQESRCGRRREPAHSRPVTRATTSSCEQMKRPQHQAGHSRPVTQLGRRGRPPMTKMVDYAKLNLDESCCWNEIPRNSNSRSNTEQVQSSQPLDFDLDNILLKAKHRNEDGVAMVMVSLRNRRQPLHVSADEHLVPGASPKEIAEHKAQVSRKFDGILKVQKSLTTTQRLMNVETKF